MMESPSIALNLMKYCLSCYSAELNGNCLELDPGEVLLYPSRFSKYGRIKEDELKGLADELRGVGHRVILCVDSLMRQNEMKAWEEFIERVEPCNFNSYRFLDPGVGQLIREISPESSLQQSMERCGFNTLNLQHWEKVFSPVLERFVLSSQMTLDNIRTFRAALQTPFELLGIGPIEVFHSARMLLTPDTSSQFTEGSIVSIDRPNSLRSRVLQTPSGTIMFYERNLFILSVIQELEEAGVDFLRFDFIDEKMWSAYLSNRGDGNSYTGDDSEFAPFTRGFIKANKTDAQFSRLQNKHIREAGAKSAKVLQYNRPKNMLVEFYKGFQFPVDFTITSPEGKKINATINSARNLENEETDVVEGNKVYFIPWVKHAIAGSVFVESAE